jgi:hypothetical protein
MAKAKRPTITHEVIDPAMAKQWLELFNDKNRTMRASHVIRLARDMKLGNWQGDNTETIKFDTEERLIDGQHRLAACVKSGVSFESWVARDVPAGSYATVGIGAVKSVADFLSPNGVRNSVLLVAAARLVYMWQNGYLSDLKNGDKLPTAAQVLEVIENNPALAESVHYVAGHTEIKKILTASFAVLIHYAGTQAHLNATVCSFLERLGSGLGMLDHHAVYHLRKFLLAHKSNKRKVGQSYILALAIKAWNATKDEKAVQSLQFRVDEKFPEL